LFRLINTFELLTKEFTDLMSSDRVTEALSKLFTTEHWSIVFWQDPEREFEAAIGSLALSGISVLRLDETPALKVKLLIERERPDDRWLLYAPFPEPEPATDWLLDLRLRSKTFRADTASIQLDELGLETQALRAHLKARAKFLRAKERVERLKRWVLPNDSADDLDRKMMAVLSRAEQPDAFAILIKLFSGFVIDGEVDFSSSPRAWQDIVSNQLDESFWALMRREFGYADAEPNLRDLLFRILVTDFARSSSTLPDALTHFVLPNQVLAHNTTVFVSRWRSDMLHAHTYNVLSAAVANDLRLRDLLTPLSAEALSDVVTFHDIELRIIADLRDRVIAAAGANLDTVRTLIARRRDGHWANRQFAHLSPIVEALAASYDALEAAGEFFELQGRFASGFSFASGDTAFAAYRDKLFRFDQLYRRFMRAVEIVEPQGWGVLQGLRDRMEATYSGWFLPQLASAWDKVVGGAQGLLERWTLAGVTNQSQFFERCVAPLLGDGARRVFVIISDAFRFEAAEDLARDLNAKSRVTANLDAMLGVLPSYTGLGMAALLPHKILAYKPNANLDMLADGTATATLDQRSAILAPHDGVAVKAEDLLGLGKGKGREFVKPWRLIYIYHDRIDLIGDKQGSESKTFEAVEDAIRELAQLTGFIINSLNGTTILITADHGFIYQESPVDEADRASLAEKPEGTLRAKKRYLLGRNIGQTSQAWCGNTAVTAGTDPGDGSLDFWVPKGASRFHFAGGARFVHGSAMPQEIVVPLITVRERDSEKTKTRPVEFSLLGSSNKVVTNKQRFEFIQTEPVSDKVLPRTVLISLRDKDRPVSDEQTLTFDSTSGLMDERKRSVILTVLAGSYDRTHDYYLVCRDASTQVEVLRIPYKIDLAFSNDF
jgi:uncharacterized protein (TIGR02687 family)